MNINYEMLWIRLKRIIESGEISSDCDIAESDLLQVMEQLELEEKH